MSNTRAVRSILEEVGRFQTQAQRALEQMAAENGLSRASWRVLATVADGGGTVAQLGRRLGQSRQSVQRVADHLVEGGWARYAPNPDHRRSPLVQVTERGKRALESLGRRLSQWESEIGVDAELEELEATLHVLRSLRAALWP